MALATAGNLVARVRRRPVADEGSWCVRMAFRRVDVRAYPDAVKEAFGFVDPGRQVMPVQPGDVLGHGRDQRVPAGQRERCMHCGNGGLVRGR